MAKLATFMDAFTTNALNTVLWNNITAGTATLDPVNDLVTLAQPTTSGATNSFGTTSVYDATAGAVYAQITPVPFSLGGTRTVMRLSVDASNSVALRLDAGNFYFDYQIAAVSHATTLVSYNAHTHRWWRLRESGGVFYGDASPDGLNWTNLASSAYTWSAASMFFTFQTGANFAEAAGNVAVISNINTRVGGPNQNWPTISDEWAPYWNANGGDAPLDRYVEVTDRTRGTVSVSRGRQYELDQVRSGEASMTLANTDAALDPTNASGPWYGHIQPYQPYRRRAQWPPSRNLLEQVMATAGDLGGYSLGAIPQGSGGADIFSGADSSGGSFVGSVSAWQGSTVMQFAVPSGTAVSTRIVYTMRTGVIPGQRYAVQMVGRNVTASTTVQVWPYLATYNAAGTLLTLTTGATYTLTGATTPPWTGPMWTTAVADPTAAMLYCGLLVAAVPASTVNVQVDAWQLEKTPSAAISPWTCPGVWYPVYAGYMERWPSSWDMSGTYATVQPNAVDAISLLSQRQMDDALTAEIGARNPRFLYRFNDPSGSLTFTDSTGNNNAAPIKVTKNGAGSITAGTAITAATTAGLYIGSSDTVITVANPSPGAAGNQAASYISLNSVGIAGPADPTVWTRVIAFRYTGPTPSDASVIWSASDTQRSAVGVPSGTRIYLSIQSTGLPVLVLSGPNGVSGVYAFGGSANVVDSNWHLAMFGYSTVTAQIMVSLDGALAAYYGGINPNITPTGITSDNIGGLLDPLKSIGLGDNYQGDLSFAAEFPKIFTSTDITNVYAAWRSACSGESTNARYGRILRYAGYTGPSTLQAGLTTSMGPATSISGQDAVSALQAVVDTENGEHFVDRQGFVQFRSRSARYNATTPVYTLGERADLGEWPYEDCQLDFDSTHLSNQITITQESTGQNFYAQDSTSITNFFPRSMTRTINSSSANECQDATDYLLSRYKQAATRVNSVKLHPSANPASWAMCLSLELGTRIRVMRRSPNVPATQVECFIENIQWDFGDDGEAWCTLQCSPADLTAYGIFAAWHTTLATSPSSGVTTITVNASADNTNPLAAQLAPGQQLVLGQNTANQETVTVASVGATSPGWTTAVITLTAATTKSHISGDIVCEPLPAGTTDPTTWDAVSKFDSIAFAY